VCEDAGAAPQAGHQQALIVSEGGVKERVPHVDAGQVLQGEGRPGRQLLLLPALLGGLCLHLLLLLVLLRAQLFVVLLLRQLPVLPLQQHDLHAPALRGMLCCVASRSSRRRRGVADERTHAVTTTAAAASGRQCAAPIHPCGARCLAHRLKTK
jgi:hypothetical protein